MITVAVIGGGAAGFFGAITCAETNARCRVTLFEKGGHVLTKVRVSGGGRCNVTHSCFDPKALVKNYPRGQQALLGPFHKFQPRDTMRWFENHGVPLKTEDDGRVFPVSDTSFSIIQALKDAAAEAHVKVRTQNGPVTVTRDAKTKQFVLKFISGETMMYDKVLLTTGSASQGYGWAEGLGHTIVTPVPSLFTLAIPERRLMDLAGISVDKAEVKLMGTDIVQKGPLLITHWGMSGPAILKLSAWGARVFFEKDYHAQIEINWVGIPATKLKQQLIDFKKQNPRKLMSTTSACNIPHRLWERHVESADLPSEQRWADLSNAQLERLLQVLTADHYWTRGKSTFKEEFVTCGGVNLDEVNFQTMESRIQPGLHFAGEILDIDGVTGGFNFQNAWTTSWLAGRAMAQV